jgi:choline monooxygenase
MRLVERREYVVECNWKVYVDNYLEGYHLPLVHPGLHRELDYERYAVEPRDSYSIQHAPFRPLKGAASERRYVAPSTEPGSAADAQYYWVFPNLMLNCYLGQLQANRVLPVDAGRTRVLFDWFASEPPVSGDAERRWRRLVDFSHEIQLEDERICEAVQRGLASGSYECGRFSASQEAGVHHFHRRWLSYVSRA